MRRFISGRSIIFSCIIAAAVSGCAGGSSAQSAGPVFVPSSDRIQMAQVGPDVFKGPSLIAVDQNVGALNAYRMRPGGENDSHLISKTDLFGSGGLVADGHIVIGVGHSASTLVEYDVDDHSATTVQDPFGTPVDIAVGKDHSLYVVDYTSGSTNVAWYPQGKPHPKQLICGVQDRAETIAVDDEGDIFLNGYDVQHNTTGVAEIPSGPNGPEPAKCKILDLQPETGYVGGIAIDPKNDALITLEDPDLCAGGEEGRMTIYPKPYSKNDFTVHDIGQNCSGTIRLNRDADIIFVEDEDVSGSYTFVIQSSFPDGRYMGQYTGSEPGGFTTIPNELPN